MFGPKLLGERPAFLGLPGNPVSAFVCALLFLAPALQALQGNTETVSILPSARCTMPLPANKEREHYMRASCSYDVSGQLNVTPHPDQDSAKLSILSESNCLLKRNAHASEVIPGDLLPILPFHNPLNFGDLPI